MTGEHEASAARPRSSNRFLFAPDDTEDVDLALMGGAQAATFVMPRIKSDSLQEGMVVAADVKNIDGMLLLPAGCSLTERHIGILQAWGVDEVEIEAAEGLEDAQDPLSKLPPEILAQWTAEAKALFWELDESSPAAMEVFNLMLRRRAKRGASR